MFNKKNYRNVKFMSLIGGCFKTYAHIRLLPNRKSQKRPPPCLYACLCRSTREREAFIWHCVGRKYQTVGYFTRDH